MPGIAESIDIACFKRYYYRHISINSSQIVLKDPSLNFALPHDRATKCA